MENNPDNRIFFDHGGLTAFDDGKNQLIKPDVVPRVQQEFHQEVRDNIHLIYCTIVFLLFHIG